MCQTMNGMWGYKVSDIDYKSADELITLLVRAAAKGSNLLLNIGPQPNGQLPHQALDRLRAIGQWMRHNGHTIYNTRRGSVPESDWGVSTETDQRLFLHVLDRHARSLVVPLARRPRSASVASNYDSSTRRLHLTLPEHDGMVDYIVTIEK